MNCDLNNRIELIEKYLLKELPDTEMKSFEAHFLSCDECFEELQQTSHLANFIKDEGNVLFKEYIQPERDSPSRLAAYIKEFFLPSWSVKPALTYAFVAVFSGLIVITVFNGPGNGDLNFPGNERITELMKQYPGRFVEAGDLENLISQQYRTGESVDVLSPEKDKIFSGEVVFEWKSESGQKLQVKVLDNNEKVITESESSANTFVLKADELNLQTGLYYWKLESPTDLLYVGKFYFDSSM